MRAFARFRDWFFRYFREKYVKQFSGSCYQGIDELPIFYWNKIHETGNFLYLVKTSSVHINKRKPSKMAAWALIAIWKQIMDQYIAKFGFPDHYLEILRKQMEIARHRVTRMTTGDKTVGAFIKIIEQEIEELQRDTTGGNFYELKAWIEKGMGIGHIDPMRITVAEFYSYYKIVEKKSKKVKAE